VVLDRTPPTASITVASTSVKVGELVSLSASAADATSGLAGPAQWTWGDNTSGASGDAVTHTYAQAGTYEVALTVTDAAGNAATAKKVITVTAPSGGTTDPGSGGSTGGGSTGGGTTDPGDGRPGDDAEPPSLELGAPRKARARAKSIPVELTASDGGRVQLSLARGARVIARAAVRLDQDGTADYRLKLPKGSKAGRYTLKATYRPPTGQPISASRKLTLTGKASARRATSTTRHATSTARRETSTARRATSTARRATTSVRAGVVLDGAPRALAAGRVHGDRPARTFKVG
jgi:PKD repeat protein